MLGWGQLWQTRCWDVICHDRGDTVVIQWGRQNPHVAEVFVMRFLGSVETGMFLRMLCLR